MKKIFLISLLPVVLLVGCSDGVPKVEDPHKIVVDGKAMKQSEFVNKYCMDKTLHETCVKVRRAWLQDSSKGEMPRGW